MRAPATLPGRVQARVSVTRRGRALAGARVSFAGARAVTGRRGTAVVTTRLELPGRFKAVARKGGRYGLSRIAEVAWPS